LSSSVPGGGFKSLDSRVRGNDGKAVLQAGPNRAAKPFDDGGNLEALISRRRECRLTGGELGASEDLETARANAWSPHASATARVTGPAFAGLQRPHMRAQPLGEFGFADAAFGKADKDRVAVLQRADQIPANQYQNIRQAT
jgi:hypothetical protein